MLKNFGVLSVQPVPYFWHFGILAWIWDSTKDATSLGIIA